MNKEIDKRHKIPDRLYQIKEMFELHQTIPFDAKDVYTLSVSKDSAFIDYHIENGTLFYEILKQYIKYSLDKELKLFQLFDVNTLMIVPYKIGEKLNFVEEYCGIKIHYSKYLQFKCDEEFRILGIRYDRFDITSDKYYLAKYSKHDIE